MIDITLLQREKIRPIYNVHKYEKEIVIIFNFNTRIFNLILDVLDWALNNKGRKSKRGSKFN